MQWEHQIKEAYLKQRKSVFVLHGNSNDIFHCNDDELYLADYLSLNLFAKREIVFTFNIGTGITFRDQHSKSEFQKLLHGLGVLQGKDYSGELPADSGDVMRIIDRYLRTSGKDKSVALIIEHADLLIPNEELASLSIGDKKTLITLHEWARSKEIRQNDHTIVLVCESVSQLHRTVTGNPDITKIEVEFPSEKERKKTIRTYLKAYNVATSLSQKAMSKIVNGLNRKDIRDICLAHKNNRLQEELLAGMKKRLIEKDAGEFIEFVETDRDLSEVAGHERAKKRLKEDAELIKKGLLSVVPMGYLICGPVGTGKTYLGECFAGEVGIPVIKLKNFREKWVGQTEANWEKILRTLQNLSPVVVMIDEADAALGNREQEGDSGTSKRVFSSLAATMGDTRNRGKLIWMLLTARPELLPVDLKRQGRAEVHIPLFYPKNFKQKQIFFEILAKKHEIEGVAALLRGSTNEMLSEIRSGADIESVLITFKREKMLNSSVDEVELFRSIIGRFRSSLDPEEVEKQVQAALDEVTDMELVED